MKKRVSDIERFHIIDINICYNKQKDFRKA